MLFYRNRRADLLLGGIKKLSKGHQESRQKKRANIVNP
jgi:hypothetical protein